MAGLSGAAYGKNEMTDEKGGAGLSITGPLYLGTGKRRGSLSCYVTMMVPLMKVWMIQVYWKVPVLVKV